MKCNSCGSEVRETSRFCTKCGARVSVVPPDDLAGLKPPSPAPPQPSVPETAPAPLAPERDETATRNAVTLSDADGARIDNFRPKLVHYESSRISEKTIVIKNPEKHTYIELLEDDAAFLGYMNGSFTVTGILKEIFERTGRMSFKRLYSLLIDLYVNDFLEPAGCEALGLEGSGTGKTSGNLLTRVSSLFKRLEIPLPPLAGVMKLFSILTKPFLSLPVQVAALLLCIAPVVFASLLQTPQAAALGGFRDMLYSAMRIFSAPEQKGYNIFVFHDSHLFGLMMAYLAAFCVLSLRTFARGAVLLHHGCEAYRPALRSFYGIFYLDVDGRDIVMADRKGRMIYYLVGISSTLTIGTAINIVQQLTGFNHVLYLAYTIAYAITFMNLCVFFKSDLFQFIDVYFEIPHLRRHALSYVSKKFFQQILNFRSSFPEEKSLTTIACVGLAWLFLAVNVFFAFIRDNLTMLVADLSDADSILTRAVIVVFLMNIVAPFLAILASLLALLLRNLVALLSAPVGRIMRKMMAGRGRTQADPAEIADFISGIPLFMNLSKEELLSLGGHLHQVQFKPGQNVVVQGDAGNAFYVILEGSADVVIENPSGLRSTVDTLKKGDSFGEVALIEHVPRTATIRAVEPLAVLELNKTLFDEFVLKSAGANEKITDIIRLTSLLRKIPFFEEMAASRIPDIISRLNKLPIRRGQFVIREGERGDLFYIIADGTFRVLKEPGGKLIATLQKNHSFGEIALLNNIPRTSSVVAETDGLLLTLSREEFLSVANANIRAGILLEEETEMRLAELQRKGGD